MSTSDILRQALNLLIDHTCAGNVSPTRPIPSRIETKVNKLKDIRDKIKSVEGELSGDCECWCFNVSEEVYKEVCGEEDYQIEKKHRGEDEDDCFKRGVPYLDEPWRLYPSDLIEYACGHRHGRVKITYNVEIIND